MRPDDERHTGAPHHAAKNRMRPRRMADHAIELAGRQERGQRPSRAVNRLRPAHPYLAEPMHARARHLELPAQSPIEAERELGREIGR